MQQIILMLGLCFPEWTNRRNFSNDFARPQTGCVYIGDRIDCDALLFLVRVEDGRAVAGADVVSLTVARRRVVDLEEKLEQLAKAYFRRIEDDFESLSVRSVIAISGIGNVAATVSDTGGDHTGQATNQILHSPETTASQNSAFSGIG